MNITMEERKKVEAEVRQEFDSWFDWKGKDLVAGTDKETAWKYWYAGYGTGAVAIVSVVMDEMFKDRRAKSLEPVTTSIQDLN